MQSLIAITHPSVELLDRSARCRVQSSSAESRKYVAILTRDSATINRRRWRHLRLVSDAVVLVNGLFFDVKVGVHKTGMLVSSSETDVSRRQA